MIVFYVFCLIVNTEPQTISGLNSSQWVKTITHKISISNHQQFLPLINKMQLIYCVILTKTHLHNISPQKPYWLTPAWLHIWIIMCLTHVHCDIKLCSQSYECSCTTCAWKDLLCTETASCNLEPCAGRVLQRSHPLLPGQHSLWPGAGRLQGRRDARTPAEDRRRAQWQ